MALAEVETDRAERATALLNTTLAHFRDTTDELLFGLRRSGRSAISVVRRRDRPVRTELATHAALLRIVAIAEDFALAALISTTERLLPSTPRFLEAMWERELGAARDWPSRRKAWKKLHRVNIQDRFSAFGSMDGFIAARNIAAHGVGNLSPKQLADTDLPRRLDRSGISIVGGRIELSSDHIENCAFVGLLFIAWLDRESRSV